VFVITAISGSYAEFAVAEETQIGSLSSTLTFPQGASIGIPYYTAYAALCLKYDTVKHHQK